jgi:hypothetical protein
LAGVEFYFDPEDDFRTGFYSAMELGRDTTGFYAGWYFNFSLPKRAR